MKKILWLSLVGVLCSSTTGCMFDYIERLRDRDDDVTYDTTVYEDPYSYDETTLEIDPGYLAGSMGNYTDFTAETYETSGYTYGTDSTTVELNAGDGYWVMTRLNITGDLKAVEPGTHLEFDSGSYEWGSGDTYSGDVVSYVSVTGCSGPSHGDYTYDSGSQTVVVDVEQGATVDDRVVYFEATYDYAGETQVVDGSFGYTVY
jgi:hypothetical protein